MLDPKPDYDKKKLIKSLIFPLCFLLLIWAVKLFEIISNNSFADWGIYPKTLLGMRGIIFSPLLHDNLNHIMANSIPLLILMVFTFYFYERLAYNVFFLIYLLSGFWTWTFAREAYHIGASGLIYGFGSFLFFSGLLKKHKNLIAISFLVVFLYGGLFWGIFPLDKEISWEGHLMGGIAGLIMSIYYRKTKIELEEEETDENEDDEIV